MNLFENYKNVIRSAVENDPTRKNKIYGLSEPLLESNRLYLKGLRNQLPGPELPLEMRSMVREMGMSDVFTLYPLGSHPEFVHLRKTDMVEQHWIITGFVDVKGSTKFFNDFTKGYCTPYYRNHH